MVSDPTSTKYIIHASITADGVIERPDIIGAVFGQTEGLLGNEMDLRDLQKGARIGRIEVEVDTKGGKSTGKILLPSAMEKVESAILGAALETIDRIGPAKATVKVEKIEDTRVAKRTQVMDRAKQLLAQMNDDPSQDTGRMQDSVRSAVQVADITKFRDTKLWCGPNVESSDSIIVVEGRSDVLNLLKAGIKNAISLDGTSVPDEIKKLSEEKTVTIFVDGDRGGDLIAKELMQTCHVDFVARAPKTREVEELPHKLLMKCLQNKSTADQYVKNAGISLERKERPASKPAEKPARGRGRGRGRDKEDGDEKPARGRGREKDEEKPARGRGRSRSDKDADEKPARGRSKDDEEKPARGRRPKKDDAKPAAKKPSAHAHDGLKDQLSALSGSLKANLLNDAGESQKELPVRELADTLKGAKDVHTVVFDGVITQRLLDIAADKKVHTIVGVKMGNVSKVPDTVEILTKDDL